MANQIAVTELVGNVMLAELANNNSLLLTGARTYESDFQMAEYRIGDTVQIRRQNNFLVNDGRVGVLQDVIDRTEPLTINHQLNVMVEFSSRELTLFVDTGTGPFNERVIRPAIQAITKRAEDLIATSAVTALNYTSGNPAAPLNTFAVVDLVYARMQEQAIQINNDGYMALAPRQASGLKSSNQNAFNDILNTDISFASSLGHYSVFDIFSNQSVPRHLVGVGAAGAVVATTVVSGESSIDLSGLGATVLVYRAGDVISFTGVNAVNPISLTDNGQLMEFVVLEDLTSTAGGLGTVEIYPPIISDPASPYRNVTTPVVATTPVTLLGAGSSIYNVNLAYAPRGLDIVIPPMEVLNNVDTSIVTDKDLNISLRVERQGMIQNDVNILRIDLLLGFKWHPDYALKVPSL
jgi:hypothetical protein